MSLQPHPLSNAVHVVCNVVSGNKIIGTLKEIETGLDPDATRIVCYDASGDSIMGRHKEGNPDSF
jgi:hypothetical protein